MPFRYGDQWVSFDRHVKLYCKGLHPNISMIQGAAILGDLFCHLHFVWCVLRHQSCSCRRLRQLQGPGPFFLPIMIMFTKAWPSNLERYNFKKYFYRLSANSDSCGCSGMSVELSWLLRTGFLLLQLASQLVETESERQKVLSAAFSLLDDQVQNLGRSTSWWTLILFDDLVRE